MNKDFHYYGTYFAAIMAGFNDGEARDIAFYAQFVDECSKRTMDKLAPDGRMGNVNVAPVYTVQSVGGQIYKYAHNTKPFTQEELAQVEPIWTAFHFLPGDNAQNEQRQELICQPNSSTVLTMVTRLINECRPNEKRAYIGMVMHILADTWAHQGFAGVPSWQLNEVVGTVTNLRDNSSYTYNYLYDDIDKNILQCTPVGPRENSVVYLGHGRLGHLPDLGHEIYRYTQKGADGEENEVEKNNPADYENALCQMIYVMQCIKQGEVFEEETFIHINRNDFRPEVRNTIALIMDSLTKRKRDNDICAEFGKLFSDEEKNEFPNKYILSGKSSLLKYMKENVGEVRDYFVVEHDPNLLRQFFEEAENHKEFVLLSYPSIKH